MSVRSLVEIRSLSRTIVSARGSSMAAMAGAAGSPEQAGPPDRDEASGANASGAHRWSVTGIVTRLPSGSVTTNLARAAGDAGAEATDTADRADGAPAAAATI